MKDNNKLSVTFFFGAGAESTGNFEILNGYDYLKKSLFCEKYHPKMLDALKDCFSDTYFNGYKYRKDTLELNKRLLPYMAKQKAESDREFFLRYSTYLQNILSKSDFEDLKAVYSDYDEVNKSKEDVKQEIENEIKPQFNKIIEEKIKAYAQINNPFLEELFNDDNGKITYELPLSTAGMLDSYFYTITNPVKHGVVKFSRVFNYYWACYFTIISDVIRCFNNDKFEQYLEKDGGLKYEKILCEIEEFTKTLFNCEIPCKENSYYAHIINNLSKYSKQIECNAVITTNYYKFASQIVENTIYLNGQLNLFEYPEILEVSDLNNSHVQKGKLFFPFLLGQSYIKPIIHDKQIQALSKFKECLNRTDVLVILGFNINEDDNHINTYLHEFVKEGKKLIIVSDNEKTADFSKRLKCDDKDFELCVVRYGDNSQVVDSIFERLLDFLANTNRIEKSA